MSSRPLTRERPDLWGGSPETEGSEEGRKEAI